MARYIGKLKVYPNPKAYNDATGNDEGWRSSDNIGVEPPCIIGIATDPPDDKIRFRTAIDVGAGGQDPSSDPLKRLSLVTFPDGVAVDGSGYCNFYFGDISGTTKPFVAHFWYMAQGETYIPEPPSQPLAGEAMLHMKKWRKRRLVEQTKVR